MTHADVVAVSGGDPFRLLVLARRVGFGDAVRAALDAGTVYVGHSAGAMLAAPTLEPLSVAKPRSVTTSGSSPCEMALT